MKFRRLFAAILSALMICSCFSFTASAEDTQTVSEPLAMYAAKDQDKIWRNDSGGMDKELLFDAVTDRLYYHATPVTTSTGTTKYDSYGISPAVTATDGAAYLAYDMRTNVQVKPSVTLYNSATTDGGNLNNSQHTAATATAGDGTWERVVITISGENLKSFTQVHQYIFGRDYSTGATTPEDAYVDMSVFAFFADEYSAKNYDFSSVVSGFAKITVDKHDGSATTVTSMLPATYGGTETIDLDSDITREGYTLAGWSTSAHGTLLSSTTDIAVPDADTTYYAVWTQNDLEADSTDTVYVSGSGNCCNNGLNADYPVESITRASGLLGGDRDTIKVIGTYTAGTALNAGKSGIVTTIEGYTGTSDVIAMGNNHFKLLGDVVLKNIKFTRTSSDGGIKLVGKNLTIEDSVVTEGGSTQICQDYYGGNITDTDGSVLTINGGTWTKVTYAHWTNSAFTGNITHNFGGNATVNVLSLGHGYGTTQTMNGTYTLNLSDDAVVKTYDATSSKNKSYNKHNGAALINVNGGKIESFKTTHSFDGCKNPDVLVLTINDGEVGAISEGSVDDTTSVRAIIFNNGVDAIDVADDNAYVLDVKNGMVNADVTGTTSTATLNKFTFTTALDTLTIKNSKGSTEYAVADLGGEISLDKLAVGENEITFSLDGEAEHIAAYRNEGYEIVYVSTAGAGEADGSTPANAAANFVTTSNAHADDAKVLYALIDEYYSVGDLATVVVGAGQKVVITSGDGTSLHLGGQMKFGANKRADILIDNIDIVYGGSYTEASGTTPTAISTGDRMICAHANNLTIGANTTFTPAKMGETVRTGALQIIPLGDGGGPYTNTDAVKVTLLAGTNLLPRSGNYNGSKSTGSVEYILAGNVNLSSIAIGGHNTPGAEDANRTIAGDLLATVKDNATINTFSLNGNFIYNGNAVINVIGGTVGTLNIQCNNNGAKIGKIKGDTVVYYTGGTISAIGAGNDRAGTIRAFIADTDAVTMPTIDAASALTHVVSYNGDKGTVTLDTANNVFNIAPAEGVKYVRITNGTDVKEYNVAGEEVELMADLSAMALATGTTTVEFLTEGTEAASYTVETYTMGTDGQYGEPATETKTAGVGTEATYEAAAKTGFTVDADASVLSGTVAADGSLVLKVYYVRNQYTLYTKADAEADAVKAGTYYYEAAVTAPADPEKDGYTFEGWDIDVPATMPANDVTLTATWEEVVVVVNDKVYISDTGDDTNDGLTADTPVKTLATANSIIAANEEINTIVIVDYFTTNTNNNQWGYTDNLGVAGRNITVTGNTPAATLDYSTGSDNCIGLLCNVTFDNITIKAHGNDGTTKLNGFKVVYGEGVTMVANKLPKITAEVGGAQLEINAGDYSQLLAPGITGTGTLNGDLNYVVNGGNVGSVSIGKAYQGYKTHNGKYIFTLNGGYVGSISLRGSGSDATNAYSGLRYFTLNDGEVGSIVITTTDKYGANLAKTLPATALRAGHTVVEINKADILTGTIALYNSTEDNATRIILFNNGSYVAEKVLDTKAITANVIGGALKANVTVGTDYATTLGDYTFTVADESYDRVTITPATGEAKTYVLSEITAIPAADLVAGTNKVEFFKYVEAPTTATLKFYDGDTLFVEKTVDIGATLDIVPLMSDVKGGDHATYANDIPARPSKKGYYLEGWSATNGGEVTTVTATGDASYYAVWSEAPVLGAEDYTLVRVDGTEVTASPVPAEATGFTRGDANNSFATTNKGTKFSDNNGLTSYMGVTIGTGTSTNIASWFGGGTQKTVVAPSGTNAIWYKFQDEYISVKPGVEGEYNIAYWMYSGNAGETRAFTLETPGHKGVVYLAGEDNIDGLKPDQFVIVQDTLTADSELKYYAALDFEDSTVKGGQLLGIYVWPVEEEVVETNKVYLSDTGLDTNDGLTAETPVLTLNKAMEIMASAEIYNTLVIVGTYTFTKDNVLGVAGKGVTVTGNDANAVFNINDLAVTDEVLALAGNVTFENVQFNGSPNDGRIETRGYSVTIGEGFVHAWNNGGTAEAPTNSNVSLSIGSNADSTINVNDGHVTRIYPGYFNGGSYYKTATVNVSGEDTVVSLIGLGHNWRNYTDYKGVLKVNVSDGATIGRISIQSNGTSTNARYAGLRYFTFDNATVDSIHTTGKAKQSWSGGSVEAAANDRTGITVFEFNNGATLTGAANAGGGNDSSTRIIIFNDGTTGTVGDTGAIVANVTGGAIKADVTTTVPGNAAATATLNGYTFTVANEEFDQVTITPATGEAKTYVLSEITAIPAADLVAGTNKVEFFKYVEAPATANAIFDANGGAWGEETTKTVETTVGETPVAPTENPVYEGFVFDGWDAELTAITAEGATYKAVWVAVLTPDEVLIVEAPTDETGIPANATYILANSVTEDSEGNVLNTTNAGNYGSTKKYFDSKEDAYANIAVWYKNDGYIPYYTGLEADTYNVTFRLHLKANAAGVRGFDADIDGKKVGAVQISGTTSSETDGIYTSETFVTFKDVELSENALIKYAEPAGFDNNTIKGGDLLGIYIWQDAPVVTTANAIFDANGGAWADGATTKTVETTIGETPVAPTDAPTYEGYEFKGWTPELTAMTAEGATYTAVWEEVVVVTNNKIYISNSGDDNNDGLTAETPVKTLTKANTLLAGDGIDTLVVVGTFTTAKDGDVLGVAGKTITVTGNEAGAVFDYDNNKSGTDDDLVLAGNVIFKNIAIYEGSGDGVIQACGNTVTFGEGITLGLSGRPIEIAGWSGSPTINIESGSFARVFPGTVSGTYNGGTTTINISGGTIANLGLGHGWRGTNVHNGTYYANINGGTVSTITLRSGGDSAANTYRGLRYYTINDGTVENIVTTGGSQYKNNGNNGNDRVTISVPARTGVTVFEINKAGVVTGNIALGTNVLTNVAETDDATRIILFNNNSYKAGQVTDTGAITVDVRNGALKADVTVAADYTTTLNGYTFTTEKSKVYINGTNYDVASLNGEIGADKLVAGYNLVIFTDVELVPVKWVIGETETEDLAEVGAKLTAPAVTVPAPTKETYYTFEGWTIGEDTVDFESYTVPEEGATITAALVAHEMPLEAVKDFDRVYAMNNGVEFTSEKVTFEGVDGVKAIYSTDTAEHGDKLTFEGWNGWPTNNSVTGNPNFVNTGIYKYVAVKYYYVPGTNTDERTVLLRAMGINQESSNVMETNKWTYAVFEYTTEGTSNQYHLRMADGVNIGTLVANNEVFYVDTLTVYQNAPTVATITFKGEDGATLYAIDAINGEAVAFYGDAPAKDNHTFLGWAVEGTTDVVETFAFTADTALVPVFEENEPEIPTTAQYKTYGIYDELAGTYTVELKIAGGVFNQGAFGFNFPTEQMTFVSATANEEAGIKFLTGTPVTETDAEGYYAAVWYATEEIDGKADASTEEFTLATFEFTMTPEQRAAFVAANATLTEYVNAQPSDAEAFAKYHNGTNYLVAPHDTTPSIERQAVVYMGHADTEEEITVEYRTYGTYDSVKGTYSIDVKVIGGKFNLGAFGLAFDSQYMTYDPEDEDALVLAEDIANYLGVELTNTAAGVAFVWDGSKIEGAGYVDATADEVLIATIKTTMTPDQRAAFVEAEMPMSILEIDNADYFANGNYLVRPYTNGLDTPKVEAIYASHADEEAEITTAAVTVKVTFAGKTGATAANIGYISVDGAEAVAIDAAGNTEATVEHVINDAVIGDEIELEIFKNGYIGASVTYTVQAAANVIEITTIPGDIKGTADALEGDGKVSLDDFVRVIRAFDSAASEDYKASVDLDESGAVNVTDIGLIKANFGKTSSDVTVVINGEAQ